MSIAAARRRDDVWRCELRLIRALLSSPDGTASTDDCVDDLLVSFADGGRWRGSVPRSLSAAGLIERVEFVKSARASRHRTEIKRWGIRDRVGLERRLAIAIAVVKAIDDWQAVAATPPPAESPPTRTAIPSQPASSSTATPITDPVQRSLFDGGADHA
jgi:hypothetical protein